MIPFRVNQYCGFPELSDLIFIWPNKNGIPFKSKSSNRLAILSGLGSVESRVPSGVVYPEEYEPAQILTTIDGIVETLAVVWPPNS